MKIGTLTFHWVTNYGAVLQAFALQKFLLSRGFEAEIINYVPYAVKYRKIISDVKRLNINNLIKEYKINKFRKKNMKFSNSKYYKSSQLIKSNQMYDIFICGSDQVWNEWFLLHSEPSINLSYYLDFVSNKKTRISYATSFGTDKLSEKSVRAAERELKKFHSINVRENTGKKIIEDMGLNANVVVDPTLLLDREHYAKLFEENIKYRKYDLFSYILHDGQETANNINDYIYKNYYDAEKHIMYDGNPISINEWLYNSKNSRLVVTNSYHGAIFAIIFHTPFVMIPVEGSQMNDRIVTLLKALGLENRMVKHYDTAFIDALMDEQIEWSKVDVLLNEIKENSINNLLNALNTAN